MGPHVSVLNTIVQRLAVEVAVDGADETEVEKQLDALESFLVEDGEVGTALGEAGEENEWEGEGWVEEGVFDERPEDFAGETLRLC